MTTRMHLFTGYPPAWLINYGFCDVIAKHAHADASNLSYIMALTTLVGILLPNIDHFFPPVSNRDTMFQRRGITHHFAVPFFFLSLAFLIAVAGPEWMVTFFSLATATAIHITQDMLSLYGIPSPFHMNYYRRWRLKIYRTGHPSEILGAVVFLAGIAPIVYLFVSVTSGV